MDLDVDVRDELVDLLDEQRSQELEAWRKLSKRSR